MAEECVVVASINESRFSEVSQDIANDSSDELIISGDGDEINSLPYDNTPLVSLNNSTSDLNGAVASDSTLSTSPTYSAMSPVALVEDVVDTGAPQDIEAMECEETAKGETKHVKVEMIFDAPVVDDHNDDDADDDGEENDAKSTKQNHRQKGK